MKADVAIITIREDEFDAVLQRFKPVPYREPGRRKYGICHLETEGGNRYTIAIARCSEQGNDTSQQLAHDMIYDFDPRLILVVGIAGGVPHDEFTLGDVIISTRIHNLDVGALHENGSCTFDIRGGVHPVISDIAGSLLLYQDQLASWNTPASIGQERPLLDPQRVVIIGGEGWRKRVQTSLNLHFGTQQGQGRLPKFKTGSIASSNYLIRNPLILEQWREIARTVIAVEMEAAGVYQAAQTIERQYPVMAIRGISDIIGLERDVQWTAYACQTAAAFTYAFILTDPIGPRVKDINSPNTSTHTSSTGKTVAPHRPFLLRKVSFIGLFFVLILLAIIVAPTLLAHLFGGGSPISTSGQSPNARVHLQETHPYCESNDGANWSVFGPQASCSDSASILTMYQIKHQYSEIDLDTIGGYSYDLTDFQVAVQATLQGQDDGQTYAALIVQTPAGEQPTGGNGGYVLAVKPTGAWRFQHIPPSGSFPSLQSGQIASFNPAHSITLGITCKKGILDLYIYQSNASLTAQSPVFSYPEQDGSFSPVGIVGLMVQHDGVPYSSTIEFTNFTLAIPG
jgi:nucleoside phosphorylase